MRRLILELLLCLLLAAAMFAVIPFFIWCNAMFDFSDVAIVFLTGCIAGATAMYGLWRALEAEGKVDRT